MVAAATLTSEVLAQAQKAAPAPAPASPAAQPAAASGRKPNILVIFGDDIGIPQISAYTMGMMGYRTPNIDRIAREGAIFTDFLRSAELHRRAARRSSSARSRSAPACLTIGMPGDPARHPGLDADDRRRHEDAGLRHRPVRQEPSRRPRRASADQARLRRVLRQSLSPQRRGGAGRLLLSEGSGVQEEVRPARRHQVDPRTARSRTPARSTQTRMPTVDEEFLGAAKDFIDRQAKADKPFFVWFNSTRMHVFTHLKPESLGKTGKGIHADGMVEHDGMVGELAASNSTISASPTTRSCSTPPTTALKSRCGRTAP